jgi:prepilin-type processing-associated H-X9-DG protein
MMKNQGLTRVEAIVIICTVLFLFLIIVPMILDMLSPVRAREEARRATCKDNLSQIGKAMVVYTQNNDEYFPFARGPANGTCSTAPGSTDVCDAGTSLGCLYPLYINTPRVFRCPSTDDQPSFVVNTPQGVVSADAQAYLWKNRNWTLTDNQPGRASSYGYDPRISRRAVGNMAIMADWDGSWQANHDTSMQNHDGGQNVLYVDGSVKWVNVNYCSNDPIDNIFIEGGIDAKGNRVFWDCDTDAYLVNGAATLTSSYYDHERLPGPP